MKKYNNIDIEQIPIFTLIQGKEKELPLTIHPKYFMYIEFNGYKNDIRYIDDETQKEQTNEYNNNIIIKRRYLL